MEYIGADKLIVSVKVPYRTYEYLKILQTPSTTVKSLITQIYDILELDFTSATECSQCRLVMHYKSDDESPCNRVYVPGELELKEIQPFADDLEFVYERELK
jgi:hypothetical protein